MGIKSQHAILLNALDDMASSDYYFLRRSVLREAEQLILQQEKRINELENAHGKEKIKIDGD